MLLRRLFTSNADLDPLLTVPPGHCSVGPNDPFECHPEEEIATRIAGGSKHLHRPQLNDTQPTAMEVIEHRVKQPPPQGERTDGRRRADSDSPRQMDQSIPTQSEHSLGAGGWAGDEGIKPGRQRNTWGG